MDTVRRQVNLEVQMQAHSETADATDAYHQGTPPDPMSEQGRHIFVYPLEGLGECEANWEVGHTQYVTSQLLHVRFQPEKVRLVGLGFNKINPVVLWITPSGCRVM